MPYRIRATATTGKKKNSTARAIALQSWLSVRNERKRKKEHTSAALFSFSPFFFLGLSSRPIWLFVSLIGEAASGRIRFIGDTDSYDELVLESEF